MQREPTDSRIDNRLQSRARCVRLSAHIKHLTSRGKVRRITKAALGGLAGCALALGGMQAASGETLLQQVFPGWLTDLDTNGPAPQYETTGAFDSAKAKLKVTETSDGETKFSLEVRDIKPGFIGREFGSHLHNNTCVTDGYDGVGKHYQNPDADPAATLEEREVWFKVVPNEDGEAVYQTVVPFVPKDPDGNGAMSIVIHTDHTKPDGTAGFKEVCLPLNVTGTWAPPVIGTL